MARAKLRYKRSQINNWGRDATCLFFQHVWLAFLLRLSLKRNCVNWVSTFFRSAPFLGTETTHFTSRTAFHIDFEVWMLRKAEIKTTNIFFEPKKKNLKKYSLLSSFTSARANHFLSVAFKRRILLMSKNMKNDLQHFHRTIPTLHHDRFNYSINYKILIIFLLLARSLNAIRTCLMEWRKFQRLRLSFLLPLFLMSILFFLSPCHSLSRARFWNVEAIFIALIPILKYDELV